ncbi:MAG TPA: metal-dependent hydrolase, partial [Candidatus Sulfopaludibacter sp.]|nr:metal-dependent hydrolase [Candidatus Sulfopaludibacter sp.]
SLKMASAITHFIVGASLALPAAEWRTLRAVLPGWAIPVTAGLLAVASDLDTPLMQTLDLPHGGLWSHRGFFHSPFFIALLCASLAAITARRHGSRAILPLAAVWAGCMLTHPLLDMLTDGGSGVLLLFPFSGERLFFPWHPIRVSPLSIARFFSRAGPILRSELPFCAAASAIGLAGQWACHRRRVAAEP